MSTNRFEIESAPPDIGAEEFHARHFLPERPVVIRGIGPTIRRTQDLSIENIRKRIIETGLGIAEAAWFQGPAAMVEPLVETPPFVAHSLEGAHRRPNHCRLWINRAGNVTPTHYDGNMIFVFNLQLAGRKEWRLVSPKTPLRTYPFSRAAILGQGDWPTVKGDTHYCDFVLEEGDMVFVPALWHHAVKATAEHNVNINWVATRASDHAPSKGFDRELELLKFALIARRIIGDTTLLNLLMGTGRKDYLEKYAGVGWDFIETHTRRVKPRRVATRLMKEIPFAPAALRDRNRLKGRTAGFRRNMAALEPKPAPRAAHEQTA